MKVDPELLERLPREMAAAIVQKLSLHELEELVEEHPSVVDALAGIVQLIVVGQVTATHNAIGNVMRVFKRLRHSGPLETADVLPVSIVIVAELGAFPWPLFRRRFLHSHSRKFVMFSDHTIWTKQKLEGCTLNKVLGFFDDGDTTVMSYADTLHLQNTVLTGVHIMPFTQEWKSLTLTNVRIIGKQNPFRGAPLLSLVVSGVSQATLDVLISSLEQASRVFIRARDPETAEQDVFYATHLCGLSSTSLSSLQVYGLAQLEDWNLPLLERLQVSFKGVDPTETPALRRLVLPNLTTLETVLSNVAHVEEMLQLGEACQRSVAKGPDPSQYVKPYAREPDEMQQPQKRAKITQHRDANGQPVKSLVVEGSEFPKTDQELLLALERLDVHTRSIEEEVAVFRSQYRDLKSLTWRMSDVFELGSVAVMKPPCVNLTELTVIIDLKVRVHYDFTTIYKSFPNLKRLTLNNSYYNRKLIKLKDMNSTLKFDKLETITLINFPEEVIDVFQHMHAPKLREVVINTMKGPLLKTADFDFRLESSSSVERLHIYMDKSPLDGFDQLRRQLFISCHPRLRDVKVSHFNTVDISECYSVLTLMINDEKTPLETLNIDRLSEIKFVSYPATGLERGLNYAPFKTLSPNDRKRIMQIEHYKQWINGNANRCLIVVPPNSPYVSKPRQRSPSPPPQTTYAQQQPQRPEFSQGSNAWGSSPAPREINAWGTPPVQQNGHAPQHPWPLPSPYWNAGTPNTAWTNNTHNTGWETSQSPSPQTMPPPQHFSYDRSLTEYNGGSRPSSSAHHAGYLASHDIYVPRR